MEKLTLPHPGTLLFFSPFYCFAPDTPEGMGENAKENPFLRFGSANYRATTGRIKNLFGAGTGRPVMVPDTIPGALSWTAKLSCGTTHLSGITTNKSETRGASVFLYPRANQDRFLQMT